MYITTIYAGKIFSAKGKTVIIINKKRVAVNVKRTENNNEKG